MPSDMVNETTMSVTTQQDAGFLEMTACGAYKKSTISRNTGVDDARETITKTINIAWRQLVVD